MSLTDNAESLFYWLRDRIYPAPHGKKIKKPHTEPDWILTEPPACEVLEVAYEWLKEELKMEFERTKLVDLKLQSILPLSSIVITLLLALITFLTRACN